MKYIKVNLSIGDKLKLLFFGIIQEDKLPTIEVVKEVQVDRIVVNSSPNTPKAPLVDINNKDEEEFHVPFFELNDGDVKSNF